MCGTPSWLRRLSGFLLMYFVPSARSLAISLRCAAVHWPPASRGSSIILAIECTVGPPDGGGKLSKLIARSEDLRSKLPDSEVIAVLATARPHAELSQAEVEKAERDDVVLLAQEDLHDLWTAAHAGETIVQVVRRLRRQLVQGRLRRADESLE